MNVKYENQSQNICKHLFHKLKKYYKKLIQIKKKMQFQNILTYIIHQN